MDRFQELQAFIAVVEAGGFSAAARTRGESQSSVSKAVGSLERRLGVVLLQRSTRSVVLTDQGQRYYERTKPLVDEIEAADIEVERGRLAVSGLVRVAAPATFGRLHILPLLADLLARHPQLRVDMVLSDTLRALSEDRIDLAIRLGTVNDPSSVVRRIGSISLVCAGSRDYFARHGTPTTPSDLAHHNCLIYGAMTEWPFMGPDGRIELSVHGNLSSNSAETILAGVEAGVGIGMFYRSTLAGKERRSKVVTVLDKFMTAPREVSLVWPSHRLVPARVRQVTEFFASVIPARFSE